MGGGNDEREQTLNQLLVEMDGFDTNEGIIIIAATNRPDVLDPALLRPGRFDRQVVVSRPDIDGREKILAVHMKKVPLAPDVIARTLARGTPGFAGADLANLVNEAALLAARRGKRLVSMREFEDAKDKVLMGTERRTLAMTEDEKKMTAYHEAGHALVSLHEQASDPIHKATIIPRGRALGMVMRLPERDQYSYHRDKMYANLAVAMGGRVAEELIFGYDKVSSGASSDLSYATDLARSMATQWGMSDKLGPLKYVENQEEVFLGHSVTRAQNMSEETAQMIDNEVRSIVTTGYARAKQLLTDHIDQLHAIAGALLEYETLTGDEIKKVMDGGTIDRGSATTTPVAAWIDPDTKPKIMNGAMRLSFTLSRLGRPAAAALTLAPVVAPARLGSDDGAPLPIWAWPGRWVGSSSGSTRATAIITTSAMPAKANIGPERPSGARMNSGAIAGPMMVPRPNADDRLDSAAVRSCSLVRPAT